MLLLGLALNPSAPMGKLKKASTWFCLQGGGLRIYDGTVFLNNCNIYNNRAGNVSAHLEKSSTFPSAPMENYGCSCEHMSVCSALLTLLIIMSVLG